MSSGGDGGSAFMGLADPFNLTGDKTRREAQAKERIAKDQLGEARLVRDRAVAAAKGDGSEIENIQRFIQNTEQSLGSQRRQLARQEEVLAASNPELIKLIQGQESSTLAPLRNQRNQQRQALLNRLRSQLGPGAETSTAGIQALNQFDMQTDTILSQSQQSSIGQLFGVSQGFEGLAGQSLGRAGSFGQQFGGAATLFGNRSSRISNAESGTGSQIVGLAGAEFVGDLVTAQQQGEGNRALINTAASVAPAMMSDKRVKEDLKDGSQKLDDMYGKLSASDYKYKEKMQNNILGGPDRYVSVMAQDLEKTELGKSFVSVAEDGTKVVNYGKGLGVMLAGQAMMHGRMKKIETTLGELLSARK